MKELEGFSSRLREERERLGLNQDVLAEIGGVARASQYLYERGSRAPNAGYLMRIFQAGVDPNYLFSGERAGKSAIAGSVDVQVLVELLNNVSDHARKHRGNKMLDPVNLVSLIQLMAGRVEGKNMSEINWESLSEQIDGWVA